MARTIMEDYYKHTDSHFELAYGIARRAREIQRRGDALVAEHDDKAIVVALREISERPSHFAQQQEASLATGLEQQETSPVTELEQQQETSPATELAQQQETPPPTE